MRERHRAAELGWRDFSIGRKWEKGAGERGDQPLETGTVGEKRQIVREAGRKGNIVNVHSGCS